MTRTGQRPLPETPPVETDLRPDRQTVDRKRNWVFYAADAGNLAYCTFADYQAETPEQKDVKARAEAYAADFDDRFDRCEGAVFYGTVGTGKDHLVGAIGRAAVYRGYQVAWVDAGKWFFGLRDAMKRGDQLESIGELTSPEVLILSEVARPFEALTPMAADALFIAINARVRTNRLTICTLNAASDDAAADQIGKAVWDRLVDNAERFRCIWPSFRASKNDGKETA